MNNREIGELILRFIGDMPHLGEWEWDNFLERSLDGEAELIRSKLLEIEKRYPPINDHGWCSEEGLNEMRRIAKELIK